VTTVNSSDVDRAAEVLGRLFDVRGVRDPRRRADRRAVTERT
jgi:hypothetical protein